MPRPQEDDVRLTVDHRQHAIDPTMGAERRLAAINPLINLPDIKDCARPRVRGDAQIGESTLNTGLFQSTPPALGATSTESVDICWIEVSIHTPAWGATRALKSAFPEEACFNPRPPRRGRRRV